MKTCISTEVEGFKKNKKPTNMNMRNLVVGSEEYFWKYYESCIMEIWEQVLCEKNKKQQQKNLIPVNITVYFYLCKYLADIITDT